MSNKKRLETITIYSNNTCDYCKQIKEMLNKENIEFNERLTEDWKSNWQNIVNLTGVPAVPKIIIEKIKTLNFNIANAFKKMDQLLNQIHTKTNK